MSIDAHNKLAEIFSSMVLALGAGTVSERRFKQAVRKIGEIIETSTGIPAISQSTNAYVLASAIFTLFNLLVSAVADGKVTLAEFDDIAEQCYRIWINV